MNRTILPTTSTKNVVANGAALLDETHPDWWRTLDLDRLNMSNTRDCVLGQTLGQLDEPIEESESLYDEFIYGNDIFDFDYGFNSTPWSLGSPYISYQELRMEWTRVVLERRAAA